MEKEYIAGEPQRYEIGGRVFIVEPRYRKDARQFHAFVSKTRSGLRKRYKVVAEEYDDDESEDED